jgi:hypothetical protein
MAVADPSESLVFERAITDQLVEMSLERVKTVVSDLRSPPFAHVVEQGSTDGGHLVPAGSHLKALAALVLRVGLSLDVAKLPEGRDRLRGRLLRHRQTAAERGGRVRSPVDGSQSELVSGPDARVTLTFQLDDDLVDHRVEATEQKKGEPRALRRDHRGMVSGITHIDNLVVCPL